MPEPKFLVVIPAYNAAEYLPEAVASVRAQTESDWLCVIVDDGSTDGVTPNLVDELAAQDTRITALHQANTGLPGARNSGWKQSPSRSEYLYFLDADDVVEHESLSDVGTYMDAHPQVGCVYGQPLFWYPDHPEKNYLEQMPRYIPNGYRMEPVPPDQPVTTLRMLATNPVIIPSASFFRRDIFERTGGWDASLNRMCEDIDMSLHIALFGEVHFLNRQVIRYRRHADNMSNDSARWWAGYRQMRRKWELYMRDNPARAAELSAALSLADLYAIHKSFHGMRGSLARKKGLDALRFGVKGFQNGATYAANKQRYKRYRA